MNFSEIKQSVASIIRLIVWISLGSSRVWPPLLGQFFFIISLGTSRVWPPPGYFVVVVF